jgi:ribosomal protein S14
MKLSFFKDLERRKYFKTNEVLSRLVKMLVLNKNLKNSSHFGLGGFYLYKLYLMRKAGRSKICNRCVETNKAGAVYRHFRLERRRVREKALFGLFCGLRKAVW